LYYKDLGFQKKVGIHGNRVFGGASKVKALFSDVYYIFREV
jgi:hypothetical protein